MQDEVLARHPAVSGKPRNRLRASGLASLGAMKQSPCWSGGPGEPGPRSLPMVAMRAELGEIRPGSNDVVGEVRVATVRICFGARPLCIQADPACEKNHKTWGEPNE